jgi:hypothetical protein
LGKYLEVAAALFAFIAAIFWFISAYGKLPPMVAYWDATPSTDPFYKAVIFAATMNRWAAGFSGLSAIAVAASIFTKRI